MAPKSKFVGVRLEPAQQRKLIILSVEAGEPGNMSAALRWLVDQVTESAPKQMKIEYPTETKNSAGVREDKTSTVL